MKLLRILRDKEALSSQFRIYKLIVYFRIYKMFNITQDPFPGG